MLTWEAANAFGLTWPGLGHAVYRTRGEHANHFTTDAVTIWIDNTVSMKRTIKIKSLKKHLDNTNCQQNRVIIIHEYVLLYTLHHYLEKFKCLVWKYRKLV